MDVIEPSLCYTIVKDYDGDVDEKGNFCGYGRATLDNGSSYEGNFLKGLLHGDGKFMWTNGVIYEGSFVLGELTGSGSYHWPDGSVYVGGIACGKRHGKGQFTSSAGQLYDGDWVNGQRHGQGKMQYTDNRSVEYTGSWANDMRDGHGLMVYASGNVYEGYWSKDMKCGDGVMQWKSKDELYMGEWKDDKPHGYGEHIWGDSTRSVALGKQSRLVCNIYRGEWVTGMREGFGTFFYANGSKYSGQFVANKKQGKGVVQRESGHISCKTFDKDRVQDTAGSPKATEDVDVQVQLGIADLFEENPFLVAEGERVDRVISSLEKLMLRYNSHLKKIYLNYCSLAGARRAKVPASEMLAPAFLTRKVDQVVFEARKLPQRIFCMAAADMRRFCRDTGLLSRGYSGQMLSALFSRMRTSQRAAAAAAFYAESGGDASGDGSPRTVTASDGSAVQLLPDLLDALGCRVEPGTNVDTDDRHPVRFCDFVELLVRAVVEKEVFASLGSRDVPTSPYKAVLAFLSTRVLPLSTTTSEVEPSATVFYSPKVRALVESKEKELRQLVGMPVSTNVVSVMDVVREFRSKFGNEALPDGATTESMLRAMGCLAPLPPPVEPEVGAEDADAGAGPGEVSLESGDAPDPPADEVAEPSVTQEPAAEPATEGVEGEEAAAEPAVEPTPEPEPEAEAPQLPLDPTVVFLHVNFEDVMDLLFRLVLSEAWVLGSKKKSAVAEPAAPDGEPTDASAEPEAPPETAAESTAETEGVSTEAPEGEVKLEEEKEEEEPEDAAQRLLVRVEKLMALVNSNGAAPVE